VDTYILVIVGHITYFIFLVFVGFLIFNLDLISKNALINFISLCFAFFMGSLHGEFFGLKKKLDKTNQKKCY